MKLLLDTHIFLWLIADSSRLTVEWADAIRNPANDVYLSVASVWEIIAKYRLGKLPLPHPPQTYLPQQRRKHGINSLPLDEASVQRLASLPLLHNDPFDRMLICQALQHGLTMVTVDDKVRSYAVPTL